MKYVNDLDGNYHFAQHIESVVIVETKKDSVFSHNIIIRMTSGKEYVMGEYTSFDVAYSMIESIVEEISQ